jgi:hypothetical protein
MKKRKKNLVLAIGLYICLHMVEQHVVNIQSLILQREKKKICHFQHFVGECIHKELLRMQLSTKIRQRFGYPKLNYKQNSTNLDQEHEYIQ